MAVTHAVLELAGRPIALCVSGINYGENIGGSIGVSGTVGAAFEADAHGIPAIAAAITAQVSEWRTFGTVDWRAATHFTRLLARQVLADGMPGGVSVLNLNVPRSATTRTELRKTVQDRQPYYARRLARSAPAAGPAVSVRRRREHRPRSPGARDGHSRHHPRPGGFGHPADLAADRHHRLDAGRTNPPTSARDG